MFKSVSTFALKAATTNVVDTIDHSRPAPSRQQVAALERFIPVKNNHLALLRCCLNIYPSSHPAIDAVAAKGAKGDYLKALILSISHVV